MKKPPSSHQTNSSVLLALGIVLVFSVVGFALYSNTFDSPFVFDDISRIIENPDLRLTQLSAKNILKAGFGKSAAKSRPVGNISLALNYLFHQYSPAGYHLVNIIIHIVTGILLFYFLRTTLSLPSVKSNHSRSSVIAFFAALVWLVHPIQTQSVTYIVQRLNSMAALFFVLAFYLYLSARLAEQPGRKWCLFGAAALSWALALGCKQNVATLPLFIFLYEWYFFQDFSTTWFKSNLKYLALAVVLFGVVAFLYLGLEPWEKMKKLNDFSKGEFTLVQRILTQPRVIVYYLSLIFFPHPYRLNLDYDFPLSNSLINPVTTLPSVVIIVGLVGLALYLAKRQRLISFCLLWFFGNLVIESSVIPLAIIFEHRLYLPSMLMWLIPIILCFRYIRPNWLVTVLVCTVVIVFSLWTYQRNAVWTDEIRLWSDVVKKSPNKARPHYNMGLAFANKAMTDKAIEHFSTAIKINPKYAYAHNNLAVALANQGKIDQALSHFQESVRINNNYAKAHNNWGAFLEKQGKLDEAIDHYHRAVNIRPDLIDAQFNLGAALVKQGKIDQGIDHYNIALRLDPRRAEVHNNLAAVLMQKGEFEAAIFHFREALRIKPDFPSAKNNLKKAETIKLLIEENIDRIQSELRNRPNDPLLHYEMGNLFLAKGDLNKAKRQYQKALTLQPRFPEALKNLALVYVNNKEYANALSEFHKMIDIWPDNAEIHYNIACMYSRLNRVDESIEWLKKAIDKGYANWKNIKTDSDLDNIRDADAYKQLVSGH